MATGGQLTILNLDDQTNLDFLPISPIDGNTPVIENNDKRLILDQVLLKDVSYIIKILSRPNTTVAKKKNWVYRMIQEMSDSLEMQIQTETEDQATQDNTPPTPSDTTRHPMACPDTKLDFEHDPELDSEDQNILTIETTDTLDNSIDKQHNSEPTFDNVHNSSIGDCSDIKQTIDNSDIGDPNESKTETIDDNMQDQTSNIDNDDQDNSEFESTEIIQTDNNTQNFQ